MYKGEMANLSKEPSVYEGSTAGLVDGGRNAKGEFIGDVLRNDVAKVSLEWSFLTVKEWADICRYFDPKRGGKFINSVKFFNQSTGEYDTREMYVSDRKANMHRRDPKTGMVLGWVGCKLSLVEV